MREPTPRALMVDVRLVQGILLLVAIEAVLFVAYRAWTGRGLKPADILWNLAAGAALIAALVASMRGASDAIMGGCLLLAGVAHVADVWRRVRARR